MEVLYHPSNAQFLESWSLVIISLFALIYKLAEFVYLDHNRALNEENIEIVMKMLESLITKCLTCDGGNNGAAYTPPKSPSPPGVALTSDDDDEEIQCASPKPSYIDSKKIPFIDSKCCVEPTLKEI
jgi:hypothetical protein